MRFWFLVVALLHVMLGKVSALTVDFDDVEVPPESDIRTLVDENGSPIRRGFINSGGVRLYNENEPWGWSRGFLVSNRTDTKTPGFALGVGDFGAIVNDASAFAGSGSGEGDDNYAIGFGFVDDLDPSMLSQLELLPFLTLPPGQEIVSAKITNTTWAGLAMKDGDVFSKRFGGPTGSDPDFFRLTVYGSSEGVPLNRSVEFFLADYRFEDNERDFVLDDWQDVDLFPLASADRIYFNLDSTDVGEFGMNTPSYFAIDDIELRERMASDLLGDFSGDGVLDAFDADQLCLAVASSSSEFVYDIDGDSLVTLGDVELLVGLAATVPGDANLDGQVDFIDFLAMSQSFGESARWSSGDYNCDGEVQFTDFLLFAQNFGISFFATTSSFVPEPGAEYPLLCLLLLGWNVTRSRHCADSCSGDRHIAGQ